MCCLYRISHSLCAMLGLFICLAVLLSACVSISVEQFWDWTMNVRRKVELVLFLREVVLYFYQVTAEHTMNRHIWLTRLIFFFRNVLHRIPLSAPLWYVALLLQNRIHVFQLQIHVYLFPNSVVNNQSMNQVEPIQGEGGIRVPDKG